MKFVCITLSVIVCVAAIILIAVSTVWVIAYSDTLQPVTIASYIMLIAMSCAVVYLVLDSLYKWVLDND